MNRSYVSIRLLLVGFAVVCVTVMLVAAFVHWGIMASFRRFRWPHEQARRARLPRVVAQVVKRVRVTKEHRQYVIRLVPPGHAYRSTGRALTFRSTLQLPAAARKQIRETGSIPVLFDPDRPDALILDRAGLPDLTDERSEYIRLGIPRWTQIPE